jgi:hypothetical protein
MCAGNVCRPYVSQLRIPAMVMSFTTLRFLHVTALLSVVLAASSSCRSSDVLLRWLQPAIH